MPRNPLASLAKALIPLLPDMATDPRKLKPGELCRALNSTPLGEVLTDRRLREHRSRAGLRIGTGGTVDLFRYAAWLVDELPQASAPAGDDEALRWDHYRSIPQKHWVEMSGRQAKVLNDQGKRYGLPIDCAVIDLPEFVRAFHDFLAVHARRLARSIGTVTDPMAEPQEPDALDLLREEQFKMARIDRLARERALLAREDVHAGLGRIAALIRSCGDTLQKKFGVEAVEVLNATLDECEREIADLLVDESADL